MNNVNMPIETIKEGNKTTKICIEDVYKMVNRVREALNTSYTKATSVLHSIQNEYKGVHGRFVIGKGVSQPCIVDAFDEEIGNNIAFMKAKLNANIKKFKILKKVAVSLSEAQQKILNEMEKICAYIELDLEGIRKHNPDYMEKENWW